MQPIPFDLYEQNPNPKFNEMKKQTKKQNKTNQPKQLRIWKYLSKARETPRKIYKYI